MDTTFQANGYHEPCSGSATWLFLARVWSSPGLRNRVLHPTDGVTPPRPETYAYAELVLISAHPPSPTRKSAGLSPVLRPLLTSPAASGLEQAWTATWSKLGRKKLGRMARFSGVLKNGFMVLLALNKKIRSEKLEL
jgi:hypothetical protein